MTCEVATTTATRLCVDCHINKHSLKCYPQKTLSDPAGYLPSHNPRYCAEPLSGQRPEQKFEFIWPQTARRWGAGLEPDYSESYNCRVYDRSVWNYHLAIERRHATGTCGVAWRAAAAAGSEHNNDGNQVQTFLLNLVSVPRWCCQFNLQNEEASCYQ